MKKVKQALAFLLCAAMMVSILAGCNQGGGGNVTYGRYVEEDISPKDMKGILNNFVSFGDGIMDITTMLWPEEGQKGKTETYYRWRTTDGGKNWEQLDMSWTKEYTVDYSEYYDKNETPPETVGLGTITPLDNGDVLFQVYKNTYDAETELSTSKTELWRLTADGTKQPFAIAEMDRLLSEGKEAMINQVIALSGGKLYVDIYANPTMEEQSDPNYDWSNTNYRGVYDGVTGQKLYDLKNDGYDMLFNKSTLFVNDNEKGMVALNIADGTPSNVKLPPMEVLQQWMYSGQGRPFVDDENNFYRIDARGLSKLGAESTEAEQVMDGINYTFGSPLFSINNGVYEGKDKSIVLAAYEQGLGQGGMPEGKLLRYVWDDKAVATSDNKLKVYSLHDNYSVRLALSEFKRQNPDVTIEYETAFKDNMNDGPMPVMEGGGESGGGNAMTEEDALRALNTELLNGTGPDVLILDGMPIASFIEKGVLEDLSAQVKGNSDLLQQVFEPLYTDGKLYVAPTNFVLPLLLTDQELAPQMKDLEAMLAAVQSGADVPAQEEFNPEWTQEEADAYYQRMFGPKGVEDQPTLYFQSVEDVFNTLYSTSAPAIFSDKGGIDKQNLAKFLEDVKAIADKYKLAQPEEGNMGVSMGGSMRMGMGYGNYEMSQSISQYANRLARAGMGNVGSFQVLSMVSNNLHWSGQPGGDRSIVGDSAQPAEEPAPLPDIKTVLQVAPGLAQGVYQPTQMMGITTTSKQKELAQKFVQAALSEQVQKYDMGNGLPVSQKAFDDQYAAYSKQDFYEKEEGIYKIPVDTQALLSSLETPFYSNDFLRGVIYKPVQDFCLGKTNTDQAVEQIVKETELYFAERK